MSTETEAETEANDLPTVMTPAEELKSLAVILRRVDGLSPASRRWLIAHLEAAGKDGDG